MNDIAVLGGTGTAGTAIAAALRGRGARVRILSRRSPEHPVDLVTGRGLTEALAGCDTVIDASNGSPRRPAPVLRDGTRRWLAAAAPAGVSHAVLVSIVGIDRMALGYYRVKVAQELLVRESGLPYTIVRCTQFHELIAAVLGGLARARVSPRSRARLQPADVAEAGEAVASAALAPPVNGTLNVAGPEVHTLSELARAFSCQRPRSALPLPLPLPPRVGRALRSGALCHPDPDTRTPTIFASWLSR